MVGPTQGAEGFGLGRGGGTYRRRLERDLGMAVDPFHMVIDSIDVVHRLGRDHGADLPVTTSDRSVCGGRAAMRLLPTRSQAALVAILALLSLLLAACEGGGGGGATGSGSASGGAIGSTPLVDRSQSRFQSDLAAYKGKVVVINFWASWCGPCKAEMPALEQVSREYAGKPVSFIGVDSSDVRDRAGKLLADLKVTYPTVYDKAGINGGIATAWSVASLPQTWFIAKDGSRSGRIPRPLSAAELRNRIDQLLTAAA